MSWDVMLIRKIDLQCSNSKLLPLADTVEEVSYMVKNVLPNSNFGEVYESSIWGFAANEHDAYECQLSTDAITFHCRGGGNPYIMFKSTCDRYDLGAVDFSTGNYINLGDLEGTSGWENHQKFVQRIQEYADKGD